MKKKPNWKLMSTKDKVKYRAKQATKYAAAIAMSALMTAAYYEHTKPYTHGMKAVESQALIEPAKGKANYDLKRHVKTNKELLKQAKLPKPREWITQREGKRLEKAGIEYWKSPDTKGQRIAL